MYKRQAPDGREILHRSKTIYGKTEYPLDFAFNDLPGAYRITDVYKRQTVCFDGILWPRHVLLGHSRHDAAATYPSAFIRDGLHSTRVNRVMIYKETAFQGC